MSGSTLSYPPGGAGGGSGTVTSVGSADSSVTVVNPTTTPDLAVAKSPKLSTARNINGVAFDGTADITVADSTKVPTTRTVNGHALSADVTVTATDVGLGNVTNDAQLKAADKDTDTTLAANSDAKIASQHAVKTYVDTAVTGLLDFKGSTDASANPNYPVGLKGDTYVVSVAGKIGGASGKSVDVGDMYLATADNAGGTEASVGTSWSVLEHNLVGALLASNNLSDVASASTARSNLGLAIGTNVEAWDTDLDAIAALSPSNDDIIQRKAGAWTNRTIAQYKTDLALTKSDIGLGNVDNTSNATERAATRTLTNARITRRVVAVTQSATPTSNSDNADVFSMTALAQAVTNMSTNQTGTPVDGDLLMWRITDNGTARALTWGTLYEASTVALPTTTVISTMLMVGFAWNTATSKWRCIAVA